MTYPHDVSLVDPGSTPESRDRGTDEDRKTKGLTGHVTGLSLSLAAGSLVVRDGPWLAGTLCADRKTCITKKMARAWLKADSRYL